ncbi:unnamed protein product [Candida verbasci]|uniref:Zinc transporter n=1 Tax=Candida verbasci TaxID=1227364 RepID=A0A9W4TZ48_9ASCO|nr:unnamed protein product [Candida verbasci]
MKIKNDSLIFNLVGSIPLLISYPIIFLSHKLSIPNNSLGSFILLNFFLSNITLIILLIADKFKIIQCQTQDANLKSTIYAFTLLFIIYSSTFFLSANNVSILYLNLFLNTSSWNLYTPLSFLFEIFQVYPNFNSISFIFLNYGLICFSFYLLSSISITKLIGSLNKSIVLTSFFISSLLLIFIIKDVSLSMLFVNLATFIVFLISMEEFQLRESKITPIFISTLGVILEYIVGGKITYKSFIYIVLSFVITPNPSFEEPKVKEQSILNELLSHSDTRAIFNFLLLNASFMFIQFLYSFRSKSLGLLSDSLHMLLDCMSLALGLIAGVISKNEINVNGKYPFGLKNFEILAGFTNGTLLVGISGSILFEAIGRLLNPVSLQKTNELIIVSILGLLVNLVGIFAFNHGHTHGHSHGHSHSHTHTHEHEHSHSHSHSHSQQEDSMNDNMKGIFLHILADALGSVGVVISTILTKYFKWQGFDPIASIIISIMIFLSAVPLIKSTSSTLLLSLSKQKEDTLKTTLNEILEVNGVVSFTSPRFWPGCDSNKICGYIHIQIYRGENSSYIKKNIEKIFSSKNMDIMIQIENDSDSCWCRK